MNCDHPGVRVFADPFLHGLGLDNEKHPHQVQWCSRCGAGRIVFGNPHTDGELTYGDWIIPGQELVPHTYRCPDHGIVMTVSLYELQEPALDIHCPVGGCSYHCGLT